MKPQFSLKLNLNSISSALSTDPVAVPMHFSGGSRAALLIHGFTGHPDDMAYLGNHLHELGWTVHIPRLPGHGTSGADFMNTNRYDWLRGVVDSYLDLRAQHGQVDLCGLSMGGVLAIILASHFPVRSLALAAPAVDVTARLMWAAPFLGPFLPRVPREPDKEQLEDPRRENLAREYYSSQWNRAAAELYRLMRMARKRLPYIHAPTLTIMSTQDNTVPMRASERIAERIGASTYQLEVLERSGHVLTNDSEKETVAHLVHNWFARQDDDQSRSDHQR